MIYNETTEATEIIEYLYNQENNDGLVDINNEQEFNDLVNLLKPYIYESINFSLQRLQNDFSRLTHSFCTVLVETVALDNLSKIECNNVQHADGAIVVSNIIIQEFEHNTYTVKMYDEDVSETDIYERSKNIYMSNILKDL